MSGWTGRTRRKRSNGNSDTDITGTQEPGTNPEPTDRDRENARIRHQIAARQAEEYDQVQAWAETAFGPGWQPSHRHYLVSIDEEDRVRYTGERPRVAATVHTVRHVETGEARHFTVSAEEEVTEYDSYQAGFGSMLWEPHPTRGFAHNGVWCPYYRYSLYWAGYERYQPKRAEELAALRASREHKKAERAEKKWASEHPLLAWAERVQHEDEKTENGPESQQRR